MVVEDIFNMMLVNSHTRFFGILVSSKGRGGGQ
jgi:hypothetical protein